MSRIVVISEAGRGNKFSLEGDVFTLGSLRSNDLCLPDPGVSPHHCRIELRSGDYVVIDEGSFGGTYVNDVRVSEKRLGTGDRLRLGRTEFLFEKSARREERPSRRSEAREEELVVRETADVHAQKAVRCANCNTEFNRDKLFCPTCGLKLGRGEIVPSEVFITPVERTPQAKGAGILPLVSLFLGIFGPLALGVGWVLAIVLGFNCLSIIRRRGGFRP